MFIAAVNGGMMWCKKRKMDAAQIFDLGDGLSGWSGYLYPKNSVPHKFGLTILFLERSDHHPFFGQSVGLVIIYHPLDIIHVEFVCALHACFHTCASSHDHLHNRMSDHVHDCKHNLISRSRV